MNPAEQALELRSGKPAALSEVFLYWIFADILSIFALIARRVKRSVGLKYEPWKFNETIDFLPCMQFDCHSIDRMYLND